MTDPTHFHQIVMNLFSNAVFAMDGKGLIDVSLDEVELGAGDFQANERGSPGPYVRLAVSDTGMGMDRKTVERIFEPFFTTKEPGKGTGMGLSVVHGIVESYNGFIRVESKPGRGTAFEVYFPVTEGREITEAADSDEEPATGTERVLLVDDEEGLAVMGERILERLGYRVTTVTSSLAALDVFKRAPDDFDILIIDQFDAGIIRHRTDRRGEENKSGSADYSLYRLKYESLGGKRRGAGHRCSGYEALQKENAGRGD